MISRVAKILLKMFVMAAVLFPLALLLKDSGHQMKGGGYDPAAPTAAKFRRIEKWLPRDAELIIVVDMSRLAGRPDIAARIAALVLRANVIDGFDGGIVGPVLANPQGIGMAAGALCLGGASDAPYAMAVIQGALDRSAMVGRVQTQLAAENARLVTEEAEGTRIYFETPSDAPFAFAFPDAHHLIAGPKEAVVRLLMSEKTPSAGDLRAHWPAPRDDGMLFGRLAFTDRLRSVLPPQIANLDEVLIYADDELNINLVIPCDAARQAQDITLFVEGMRTLYLLDGRAQSIVASIMRGMRITNQDNAVVVHIPTGAIP